MGKEEKKKSCSKSCGPGDWYKGGKCDVNGCFYTTPTLADFKEKIEREAEELYPDFYDFVGFNTIAQAEQQAHIKARLIGFDESNPPKK